MKIVKLHISDKEVAFYGATIAVAGVFGYSIIVMIYTIIRSSGTILSIMPIHERNTILFINGFSVAYSITVFSLIMAGFSAVIGVLTAVILKKSLLHFNPFFYSRSSIFISSFIALTVLTIIYLTLYGLLKEYFTFYFPQTFVFWFIFPALIFLGSCIYGGFKLNQFLCKCNVNKI